MGVSIVPGASVYKPSELHCGPLLSLGGAGHRGCSASGAWRTLITMVERAKFMWPYGGIRRREVGVCVEGGGSEGVDGDIQRGKLVFFIKAELEPYQCGRPTKACP